MYLQDNTGEGYALDGFQGEDLDDLGELDDGTAHYQPVAQALCYGLNSVI